MKNNTKVATVPVWAHGRSTTLVAPKFVRRWCVVVLTVLAAHTAAAIPIPNAAFNDNLPAGSFSWECTTQSCVYGGPLTLSQYYAGGTGSMAIAGSNISPYGTQLSSGGMLTYYAEVVGPENISVPVDFIVSGSASTSSSFDDVASAHADFNGNGIGVCAGGGNCNGPTSASFGGSYLYSVMANDPFQIQLIVTGLVGDLAGNNATFSAEVDSSVTIDSSFTTAGYSMIFSPDLGGPPVSHTPVPEPSSLSLVVIATLAMTVRGRRKTA